MSWIIENKIKLNFNKNIFKAKYGKANHSIDIIQK